MVTEEETQSMSINEDGIGKQEKEFHIKFNKESSVTKSK